jgi:hypothetical protein
MSQAGSSRGGPGEERSDPVALVKQRLASALIYPPVMKSHQGARAIANMEEALAEAEGLGMHHCDAAQLVRNEIGAIRRLGRGAVQAQETLQVLPSLFDEELTLTEAELDHPTNPHRKTKPSIFRSRVYLDRDPEKGVSVKVNP